MVRLPTYLCRPSPSLLGVVVCDGAIKGRTSGRRSPLPASGLGEERVIGAPIQCIRRTRRQSLTAVTA